MCHEGDRKCAYTVNGLSNINLRVNVRIKKGKI